MTITVYSTPSCAQCKATYRALNKHGLKHEVVDMSENPEALARAKGLGYTMAPVVFAGDDHWGGFRPDKIKELASRLDPVAAAA